MDSNLNISPKMSYGVFEHDYVILHAYDFVIKDFVIKRGHYFFQTLYNDLLFLLLDFFYLESILSDNRITTPALFLVSICRNIFSIPSL